MSAPAWKNYKDLLDDEQRKGRARDLVRALEQEGRLNEFAVSLLGPGVREDPWSAAALIKEATQFFQAQQKVDRNSQDLLNRLKDVCEELKKRWDKLYPPLTLDLAALEEAIGMFMDRGDHVHVLDYVRYYWDNAGAAPTRVVEQYALAGQSALARADATSQHPLGRRRVHNGSAIDWWSLRLRSLRTGNPSSPLIWRIRTEWLAKQGQWSDIIEDLRAVQQHIPDIQHSREWTLAMPPLRAACLHTRNLEAFIGFVAGAEGLEPALRALAEVASPESLPGIYDLALRRFPASTVAKAFIAAFSGLRDTDSLAHKTRGTILSAIRARRDLCTGQAEPTLWVELLRTLRAAQERNRVDSKGNLPQPPFSAEDLGFIRKTSSAALAWLGGKIQAPSSDQEHGKTASGVVETARHLAVQVGLTAGLVPAVAALSSNSDPLDLLRLALNASPVLPAAVMLHGELRDRHPGQGAALDMVLVDTVMSLPAGAAPVSWAGAADRAARRLDVTGALASRLELHLTLSRLEPQAQLDAVARWRREHGTVYSELAATELAAHLALGHDQEARKLLENPQLPASALRAARNSLAATASSMLPATEKEEKKRFQSLVALMHLTHRAGPLDEHARELSAWSEFLDVKIGPVIPSATALLASGMTVPRAYRFRWTTWRILHQAHELKREPKKQEEVKKQEQGSTEKQNSKLVALLRKSPIHQAVSR